MALTDIQKVRLLISDSSEPYMFSDEEIQEFLDMSGGNVRQAAILAIYSTISYLAKNKSVYRETAGNIEVWSNAIEWYKLLLGNFNSNPVLGLGALTVYAAGIDKADVWANKYDPSVNHADIPRTSCDISNCFYRFADGVPDLPAWMRRV
jgi:hypothetical protein